MFCDKCGAQVDFGAAFCTACGAPAPAQQPQQNGYEQPPVQQPVYQQPAQPVYQQPQQPVYQQPYYQQPQQPYYPQQPVQPAQPAADMGWFKFLIYFALFAGAVLNFFSGIGALTGLHYLSAGVEAEMVYDVFPDMQLADILFGIGCIGAAVLGFVTRFALSGYKANGPKLLTSLYVLVAGLGILYSIMAAISTNGAVDVTSNFSSIAVNIVFMCINIGYFKKRAHLFVN